MKRKAAATASLACDEKLRRVAQALDNATRVGAMFATGSSERFPLPAIAFKGDDGDDGEELLLPLRKDEALEIKTRGTVSQRLDGVVTAWEVDGGALELRNPRWHEFLDECLTDMRESMGIAPTASVELSLSKLRIVESGAMLHVPGNHGERVQRNGVFGTLLVVLPSAFGGGTIVFEDDDESEGEAEDDEGYLEEMAAVKEELTWRPSARRMAYDLAYAAFYDHCSYVAEPVTSGAALCLMYDLVTTTPGDVPLYAGSSVVHNFINEALTDYFNVASPTLAKRCKISPDAWRTINEFAAERHFVRIVPHGEFEDLDGDEAQIMHSLAAFCTQSRGQFVLYLTRALCYRTWKRRQIEGSSDDEHDEKDGAEVTKLKLLAPWLKYDTSVASDYPPIDVCCHRDVAPMGLVDQFRMESPDYLYDRSDCRLAEKLLGKGRDVKVCFTYALVVQPASIELRQIAKLPFEGVIETFYSLLPESRDEALEYARRVFFYRPEWHGASWTDFPQLVQIVVEINDIELFKKLLGTVYVDARKSLRRGVAHFGWDSCADSLLKRIVSSPTLRGRVNWVLSVIPRSAGAECINSLLDALLSLHPWTDVMVAAGGNTGPDEYLPSERQFQSLLALGHLSSQERLIKIATVTHAEEMVRLVAPALTSLVDNYPTETQLLSALHHVWGILQKMMPDIRNERFASIRISHHCDKCVELQSFLSSTEIEVILTGMSDQECDHIKTVVERAVVYPADVLVERVEAGSALQLVKRPGLGFDGLFNRAERAAQRIIKLLHPN